MKATKKQVQAVATQVGRSCRTVWRWAAQGCNLDDPASVSQYLEGNALRQNANLRGAKDSRPAKALDQAASYLDRMELGPIGKKGAAAALARLEAMEERAHARMLLAIESGNPFKIKATQEFYLRASEALRRLDLAVEIERRNAVELVPQKLAADVALYLAEWLRIAFAQFLSSEARSLMGIRDPREFELYSIDRFRGIIYAAVKTSRKTRSPVPLWAEAQVHAVWDAAI